MTDEQDQEGYSRRMDNQRDSDDRWRSNEQRWGFGETPGMKNRRNSGNPRGQRPPVHRPGNRAGNQSRQEKGSEGRYQKSWPSKRPWSQPEVESSAQGYHRSDETIFETVRGRLRQHAQINAQEIEVKVSGGIVTLSGRVEDSEMKRMVQQNVEMVPGVIAVRNELVENL